MTFFISNNMYYAENCVINFVSPPSHIKTINETNKFPTMDIFDVK